MGALSVSLGEFWGWRFYGAQVAHVLAWSTVDGWAGRLEGSGDLTIHRMDAHFERGVVLALPVVLAGSFERECNCSKMVTEGRAR